MWGKSSEDASKAVDEGKSKFSNAKDDEGRSKFSSTLEEGKSKVSNTMDEARSKLPRPLDDAMSKVSMEGKGQGQGHGGGKKECLSCRLIGGTGLTGAGVYVASKVSMQKKGAPQVTVGLISAGLIYTGIARLLNLFPFHTSLADDPDMPR